MIHDLGPIEPPREPPIDMRKPDSTREPFREGVHFGLDEPSYYGGIAFSYSGLKQFRVSPYLWWAHSSLNPLQAEVLAEEKYSEAKMLGNAFDARIICGKDYFASKYAKELTIEDCPTALVTMDDVKERIRQYNAVADEPLKLSGKKAELIDRLLSVSPTEKIWDVILDGYMKENEGKRFLTADWLGRIEIAAALIEKHPELSKALKGGAPQVSIMWNCEKTGIPMRARLDYLKQKLIVDLKTMQVKDDLPLEAAIGREIGFRKYFLQSSFYLEATKQLPRLIREKKVFGTPPDGFLEKLLAHPDKTFAWIFQTKSAAPQAFGYILSPNSYLHAIGDAVIDDAKHRFRQMWETYGELPWVDPTGFRTLDDAQVPSWSVA